MVLKSLELQGFKSFPDKTELKFGKGITAVVGPNGSGKSNISDAVRWVLGEQRTKSLRGSKMEDVIFGGTSSRRALGFAQVTLRLDNTDRSIPEKGDEIAITRRYYRSGDTNYKIDGADVRLRDIQELFMDTGLGRNGYSLIGQGKIDSIISSKSEERREIFEEAAGISRFRARRTDANRRLDQAQENLVRLLDILKELEDRVGPLKEQSEKAAQFLEYAQEKKGLEIGLWLHKIHRSKEEFREQEQKIDIASAQHQSAQRELEQIEEEIEKIIAETSRLAVAVDEIRRSAGEWEEGAVRKDAQSTVLENSILHNEETIERIRKDRSEAQTLEASLTAQIGEKEEAIRQLEAQIAQKKQELEQSAQSLMNLQNETMDFSQQAQKLNQELSVLSLNMSDERVRQSQAESSIEAIRSRQDNLSQSAAEWEKQASVLKERKQESDENLRFCQERVEELTNAVNGYGLRLKSREAKLQQAKEAYEQANLQFQQKSSRIHMLEDLEKNMEGYYGSVKAVMRQARNGAMPGIHGPVSQLITVEERYSAAIETALGAAMQHIVTQTENDAKRAIQYLKQNRGGRATFLPISAIRGRILQEPGLEDCLGYLDLASHLVTCEGKYQEILNNLLGHTVVVDDMDSAIGIAKQYRYRFRIVTLDGQIINAGGSMTGGSRTQNAGILSRGNEIEKLKQEELALESRKVQLAEALKTAREEFSSCQAQWQGASADLATAGEDKIRQEGEARLIDEQLQAARRALDDLLLEEQTGKIRQQELEKTRQAAQQALEQMRRESREKEEELEGLTGSRDTLSARREELNQAASRINLEILTASKDIQAARESIADFQARKESHAGKMEGIDTEIEELQNRNRELAAQIQLLKTEAAALRDQAAGAKEEIQKTLEQRNELERRSGELRLLERSQSAEREKISGELARLEERKAAMLGEYEDTVNKLYDEYQLTVREAEKAGESIDDLPKASRRLNELKNLIRQLGSVNVGAIEEYKEVSQRYAFLKGQIEDVEQSRDELVRLIEDLTRSMSEKFKTQFAKINEHFKVCFQEFFGGGKGELRLEDENNVLESGIEIRIQPPGKSVQNIDLFSGGEKALAAIALLFSILKVTPAPFCIYDEVEAALDDVNVERFARYMRKVTDKTQFISITHRRGTMEEADVLYGVTMQEKGVSKLLELKTSELAGKLGIEG